jgi:hypothetical protein
MAGKLSEQLDALSARAKKTKESLAAAETEARTKFDERKAKAHADATAAVAKVDQQVKGLNQSASAKWTAAGAKISSDMTALKSGAAKVKHNADAKLAAAEADRLERDAAFAIDYAIATIEQANLAVLDAVESRAHARSVAKA